MTKRNLLFLLSFCCVQLLFSARAAQAQMPAKYLQAFKKITYLSELEKQTLAQMNWARQQPKKYAKYLQDTLKYYQGNRFAAPGEQPMIRKEGIKAVKEAIAYLKKKAPTLTPLKASSGLSKSASDLANDIGAKGIIGHIGSDGSTLSQRINRYGQWRKRVGENINFGEYNAQNIMMQLIIDDGVKDRGHRKVLFNKNFKVAGIACGKHKVYRTMCVIDYAGGFEKKP